MFKVIVLFCFLILGIFCKEKDTLCPKSRAMHMVDFMGTLSQCVHLSVSLKEKLLLWNNFKKPLCNLQSSLSVLCCKRKLI